MNIKQLEAFQAIMATGSTMAAAARLGLSQSAVSRLLTQLEQSLGFPVFFRKKGRLVATPEGEEYLREVEVLIDHSQRVQRVADELRMGRSQKNLLKLAVPASITHTSLPLIISEFLKHRQNTVIELITGPYDVLERSVFDRSADFALVSLPPEVQGFEVMPVLEANYVCILPKHHPLARNAFVTASDLANEPLILTGRKSSSRQELEQWFADSQVTPVVRVEVHSVSTACALVARNVGISIANGLLANEFSGSPIVMRPLRPVTTRAYGLIFRSDVPKSRATLELALYIKEQLTQHSLTLAVEEKSCERSTVARTTL